jgi:hypothetical protein
MAVVQSSKAAETDVSSSIYFLARDEKYNTIKPYHARYDPGGKFPYTNIDSVKCDVLLQDMRPRLDNLQWERCGFKVVLYEPQLRHEDYKDATTVQDKHIPEILKVLKSNLKASSVHKIDYMACLARPLHLVCF